jgi:hypothetical protein
MIITESKALSLIANAELAARVPALNAMHQSFVQTKRAMEKRRGCGDCNLSEPEFVQLKSQALLRIRTLPDADIERLKQHLVVKQLVFFVQNGSERKKVTR